jgi:hypothetical protein
MSIESGPAGADSPQELKEQDPKLLAMFPKSFFAERVSSRKPKPVSSTIGPAAAAALIEARPTTMPRVPRGTVVSAPKKTRVEVSEFALKFGKYLPFAVVERFAGENPEISEPEIRRYPACAAFVDISGFTKLSEALVEEKGFDGAELLNTIVSSYFTKLIDVILSHGGE